MEKQTKEQQNNRQNKSNTSANTYNSTHPQRQKNAAPANNNSNSNKDTNKPNADIYDPTTPQPADTLVSDRAADRNASNNNARSRDVNNRIAQPYKAPDDFNNNKQKQSEKQHDRPTNATLKEDIYDPTSPDLSEDAQDLS